MNIYTVAIAYETSDPDNPGAVTIRVSSSLVISKNSETAIAFVKLQNVNQLKDYRPLLAHTTRIGFLWLCKNLFKAELQEFL